MINIKKNHDLGMLLLRLATGIIFIAHGWAKFSDMTGTVAFFGHLGMPSILAYLQTISPGKLEIALVHALEVGVNEIRSRRARQS